MRLLERKRVMFQNRMCLSSRTPLPVISEGVRGSCRQRSAFEIPFPFLWRLGGVETNHSLSKPANAEGWPRITMADRTDTDCTFFLVLQLLGEVELEAVRLQCAALRQSTSHSAFYQTMKLCAGDVQRA